METGRRRLNHIEKFGSINLVKLYTAGLIGQIRKVSGKMPAEKLTCRSVWSAVEDDPAVRTLVTGVW